MMLCLVTDRRRRPVVDQVRDAAHAGVDLIQVRERDLEAAPLAALVAELVRITRGTGTRVVVNERLDVALACGADGVHLPGDSMPAARARAIAPTGFVIGRSVHGVDEARRAAPDVDYLVAGTVFATTSKPGKADLLGLDGLASLCRAVPAPVLAIGGITTERLEPVAAAGAAGVAAIGLFAGDGDLTGARVGQIRRRFDRAKTAS
jgi:thiamine-phosphate pyrophosphorylase